MYERVRRPARHPGSSRSAEREAGRFAHDVVPLAVHAAPPQTHRLAGIDVTPRNEAAVVQRWLDPHVLRDRPRQDRRTAEIGRLVVEYESNRRGKSRATRLSELNAVEVEIYRSLDAMVRPDLTRSGTAQWMRTLMNDVQREHRELVQAAVQGNDANPPVANFAQLGATQQNKVRTIWTQLVAGTGNVRITETETYDANGVPATHQHAGFRFEVLAQFARLLETQVGRDIVAQVNASTGDQKLVTIKPGMAAATAGRPPSEFAAGPTLQHDEDKLTEFDLPTAFAGQPNARRRRAALAREFVPLVLDPNADVTARAKAVYEIRRTNPHAKGVVMAGRYYKFGAGSAVDVTMTRDIPDASEHHTSRVVDRDGNELIFPNFVTLGHELGHAAHIIGGAALGDQTVSDRLFARAAPGAQPNEWSNFEEFATINTVENALRGEYGLRARHGHGNQATFQQAQLRTVVNDLYGVEARFPANVQALARQDMQDIGTHLGGLQIPAGRTSLRAAIGVFIAQLATAFPAFTVLERTAVTTELTSARNHVASAEIADLQAAAAALQRADALINAAQLRVAALPAPQPPAPARHWLNPLGWLGL